MKILLIMPWIKPGGAELIAVQTADQLQRRSYRVRLVALFAETEGMAEIAQKITYVLPPIWISRLCQKSKIFLYFIGPMVLFWLVLKEASWADLLFPQSLPSYWVAPVAGRLFGRKTVWLCNEPPRRKKLFEVGLVDWLMWFAADSFLDKVFVKMIDRVIVYSNAVAQEVKQRYAKNSTMIRLGVDYHFFSKTDKKELLSLKSKFRLNNKFILLMVGKLHPQKNQSLGVSVLAKVAPKIRNAVLVLVGEGSDKDKLKIKSRKLNVEDKVIFAGFCRPEVVRAWYGVADLLLFPSVGQTAMVSQSWGFIPFEALCQKKITIVSEGSGAAEVLQKEKIGIVLPPKADQVSRAVLSILEKKKDYQLMAQRGYDYVRKNLIWEKWGEKLDQLLQGEEGRR